MFGLILYFKLEYCDMFSLNIVLQIKILWYIWFGLYSKLMLRYVSEYMGRFRGIEYNTFIIFDVISKLRYATKMSHMANEYTMKLSLNSLK